jgi:hypothetical protein
MASASAPTSTPFMLCALFMSCPPHRASCIVHALLPAAAAARPPAPGAARVCVPAPRALAATYVRELLYLRPCARRTPSELTAGQAPTRSRAYACMSRTYRAQSPDSHVEGVPQRRAAHTEPSQAFQETRRHLLLPGPLHHLRVDVRVSSERPHLSVLGLAQGHGVVNMCAFHSSRLPIATPRKYLELLSSAPMGHIAFDMPARSACAQLPENCVCRSPELWTYHCRNAPRAYLPTPSCCASTPAFIYAAPRCCFPVCVGCGDNQVVRPHLCCHPGLSHLHAHVRVPRFLRRLAHGVALQLPCVSLVRLALDPLAPWLRCSSVLLRLLCRSSSRPSLFLPPPPCPPCRRLGWRSECSGSCCS